MTINVAVVTSEALVLGCDSIASTMRYFVDPFSVPSVDLGDGKVQLTVSTDDIVPHVTNSWDGVTKMFLLNHAGGTPVAAVTAGLAKMNDRSMSSYANQFLEDAVANTLH